MPFSPKSSNIQPKFGDPVLPEGNDTCSSVVAPERVRCTDEPTSSSSDKENVGPDTIHPIPGLDFLGDTNSGMTLPAIQSVPDQHPNTGSSSPVVTSLSDTDSEIAPPTEQILRRSTRHRAPPKRYIPETGELV